ncbi:uncharacterized protein [Phaseolus vulgaris]|uniref:uncharacterized protein n=1 Tax=Phaseolus vulgaris TaxID=3885 RepID=UPI0035CBB7E8
MYGYYMPKPKRIKNLLKAIGGHSSDTSVRNYVQPNDTPQTTRQQITKSGQPHIGSPLPQASGHTPPQISKSAQPRDLQPTFESAALPQTESTQPPISQSAQPEGTSESAQPHTYKSALPHTSESTLPHTSESTEPHTPQSAQSHTLESEAERVAPKKGRHSNHYWFVDTIDEHGVTQKMKLKVRDAHNLPTGIRVLAANHILLPISFESWSSVPDTYKDTIWESALKVNEDLAKRDVMFKIGKLWREYRCKLWNEFYDPVLSRNDLIKNVPDGLNMEQWAIFVDYRLKPSIVKLCNSNREIRKKQTIPHTGGAMALSRRRENLKIETGRNIGRAEMWKITHKRKNGTYVNDEAMEIGDKIDELMLENPETASHISPNDPVGVIFGKEHPGRVRGLSYGACPTLAFRKSTTRVSNMNNGSSSGGSSTNVEEKVEKMATELAVVRSQMHTMLAYIASRPDVLEHFAAMATNLVQTSINEAPDVASGAQSPNQNIRSSGGSKTN